MLQIDSAESRQATMAPDPICLRFKHIFVCLPPNFWPKLDLCVQLELFGFPWRRFSFPPEFFFSSASAAREAIHIFHQRWWTDSLSIAHRQRSPPLLLSTIQKLRPFHETFRLITMWPSRESETSWATLPTAHRGCFFKLCPSQFRTGTAFWRAGQTSSEKPSKQVRQHTKM